LTGAVSVLYKSPVANAYTDALCANHPQREAVGICVDCRKRVCVECTTKVDGINHCVSCLRTMSGPAREEASVATTSPLLKVASLIAMTGVLSLLTWGILELGALW
jgi:hypothetical protein